MRASVSVMVVAAQLIRWTAVRRDRTALAADLAIVVFERRFQLRVGARNNLHQWSKLVDSAVPFVVIVDRLRRKRSGHDQCDKHHREAWKVNHDLSPSEGRDRVLRPKL
jgi:hypothetical protein